MAGSARRLAAVILAACIAGGIASAAAEPAAPSGSSTPTTAPVKPSAPTIMVTPSSGLLDKQVVTVAGAGFLPNEDVGLVECIRSPDPQQHECDVSTITFPRADALGSFNATIAVRRVALIGRGPVDCVAMPICVLEAASFGNLTLDARQSITFADVPFPRLVAVPSTGLVDGQTVEVFGSGFTPFASIGMTQCKSRLTKLPGPGGENGCDLSNVVVTTADADGSVRTAFTVRSSITTVEFGTVNCTISAGNCVVGAGNPNDPLHGESAADTLVFSIEPSFTG
jgi:hypothetical protein